MFKVSHTSCCVGRDVSQLVSTIVATLMVFHLQDIGPV